MSDLAESADANRGAALLVNGRVVPVEVTTTLSSVSLGYENASVTVECFDADGNEIPLSAETRFVVRRGDTVRVTATGFAPDSEINVAVFSDPTALGIVTIDATGAGRQQWALPDTLSPGDHTLVASGDLPEIDDTVFGLRIIVDSPSFVTRVFSSTATRVLLALGVIIGLIIPATRRRRRDSQPVTMPPPRTNSSPSS